MPTVMRNGVPTYISVEEYNNDLANHRKEVLGVDENTGRLKHYNVENLGKIWINGQEFTGMAYQGLLTVNTKTYVKEPTRTNDGSIPNINDYDTFIVPRCEVNFKYFNVEDYRRLCNAVQSNEFYVKYYDVQHNEFVQHKMYCEPAEMTKLYNVGTEVFGVLDYKVSFIGTLNELEIFNVTYEPNGGTISNEPKEYVSNVRYKKGDRVYIGDTYYVAIFYQDTFKEKPVSDIAYWAEKQLLLYNNTTKYSAGQIVYEQLQNGRKYYVVLKDTTGNENSQHITDSMTFSAINVRAYNAETTYSRGNYVVESDKVYEAIYYLDTFSGHYPTETAYWSQMPLGTGVKVKWGNSIVVPDPESLFTPISGYSANSWNTLPDGTGFTYFAGQSLNVFRNLTLYPEWKTAKE